MNSKTLVLEKRGEIHKIEGTRTMDSLQYWRYMMRLIIATKSTEGIKKTPPNLRMKNQVKIL
jgi:hypothetical protein